MNRPLRHSPEHGGIISKLIFLGAFVTFLALLYLLRAPILRAAGDFLIVDDGPSPADAIIILSDDDYFSSRVTRAAQLYHSGLAPHVVASGRMLRPYAGIAELMERDLTDRGVPRDAIIRSPHHAENTLEEVRTILQLVTARGWHRVLIVTTDFHTRRARFIFTTLFPSSVQVRVVSAPDPSFDAAYWWRSRRGVKMFFLESAGYVVARWELRHASAGNPPAP